MAVDVTDEGFLPAVDDLHRTIRVQREHRPVDLHRQVLAPAEGAADAGEVDPNLLRLQPETRRDLIPIVVQPLRRDVDVHSALAVGDRQPGLGPEERLVLDGDLVHAGNGYGPLSLRISVADHDRADHVRPRIVAVAVLGRRLARVERLLLRRVLRVNDRIISS